MDFLSSLYSLFNSEFIIVISSILLSCGNFSAALRNAMRIASLPSLPKISLKASSILRLISSFTSHTPSYLSLTVNLILLVDTSSHIIPYWMEAFTLYVNNFNKSITSIAPTATLRSIKRDMVSKSPSYKVRDSTNCGKYQSPLGGKDDPRRRTSKAFSDPSTPSTTRARGCLPVLQYLNFFFRQACRFGYF